MARRSERKIVAMYPQMSQAGRFQGGAAAVSTGQRLWRFSRKTGYRIIKAAMEKAKITGLHASPKGLRHGFGIACVQKSISMPTIAKWMEHSDIKNAAIYLKTTGQEDRLFSKIV